MHKASFFLAFCVTLFLLASCAKHRPIVGYVEDISTFPQDLFAYVDTQKGDTALLTEAEQNEAFARSKRLFFHPWKMTKASISKKDAYMMLGANPQTTRPTKNSSNLLPWTEKAWKALAKNAQPSTYPSMKAYAITLRPSSLRLAPTKSPGFGDLRQAGQGFPFDLFQNSAIHLAMPLFITHKSLDGAWYYAETAMAAGWISAHDIAFVDEDFRKNFEERELLVLIDDFVSLLDKGELFISHAHMGSFLPLADKSYSHLPNNTVFKALVPTRQKNGFAALTEVFVPKNKASEGPLALTQANLASLGNKLLERPYGWGGLFEDRDCSALLRDIFLACGLWLPRNSSAQAKAWDYTPFQTKDAKGRKQEIAQEARPFATLLWLPGHIALYLGTYNGEPAILHSIWGLRTFSEGKEGRHVLGRVLISGTQAGKELPNRAKNIDMLLRMKGMSTLP